MFVFGNVGALIIRIGFGGLLYYNVIITIRKPQNPIRIIKALTLGASAKLRRVCNIGEGCLIALWELHAETLIETLSVYVNNS